VAATVVEGAGSTWMAYAGTATGAATVYLPNITRNLGGPDGWNTPFIVQNIGAAPTTASVLFYRFADGALATRIDNVSLQPGRSRAFTPSIIDGLADDTQYAVVVQGATGAQLYAIVNEASGAMAMSYEGLLSGSNVIYLPNVLKYLGGTDHWYTPFIVQNLGNAATTANIEFYSFATGALVTTLSGVVLQPGRSAPIDVRFDPATLPAGSYSVVIRGGAGSLLGAVVNETDPGAGMAMAYLGIGQSQAQPSAYLPVLHKNTGAPQWFSPIIAQNVGSTPADITLTLFNANGDVAQQRVFPAVKPGAAAVYDPRFDRRLPNGTYSGLVQSTANVSAVVNVSGAISGDYAMSFTSTAAAAAPVPAFGTDQTKQVSSYQMTLQRTPNTDVWIETTIDQSIRSKLANIAEADTVQVQTYFARPFTNIPVVYIFATTASYTAGLQALDGYTPTQAAAIADASVALFQPASKLVLVNWGEMSQAQPKSDIRHELTHAMVQQIIGTSPSLPMWLTEGLAMSEELTVPGAKYLAMEVQYGTASMAYTGTYAPINQLESPALWSQRTGTYALYQYLESAEIVEMLRQDLTQAGIVRVLELLGQGRTFEDAYRTVSGKPWADFVAAFQSRARALAPTYPGVITAPDTVLGTGLTIMAYGFAPLAPITIEIRSSTDGGSISGKTSPFGTATTGIDNGWAPGTYKVTATSGSVSVSVVVMLSNAPTGSVLSIPDR
ncbi:MAG TPA: hypothetical protein VI814_06250, partial [Candidatus Limnocylindria bacterium]